MLSDETQYSLEGISQYFCLVSIMKGSISTFCQSLYLHQDQYVIFCSKFLINALLCVKIYTIQIMLQLVVQHVSTVHIAISYTV